MENSWRTWVVGTGRLLVAIAILPPALCLFIQSLPTIYSFIKCFEHFVLPSAKNDQAQATGTWFLCSGGADIYENKSSQIREMQRDHPKGTGTWKKNPPPAPRRGRGLRGRG